MTSYIPVVPLMVAIPFIVALIFYIGMKEFQEENLRLRKQIKKLKEEKRKCRK